MKGIIKALGLSILSFSLLTACGKTEKETDLTENAEKNEENKEVDQSVLGAIGEMGKVTVVKEFESYKLEGNEQIDYELTDVKIVKLEDLTEDGKMSLLYSGSGYESEDQLPESVYVLIGNETKKNNTDMTIEFAGVIMAAVGTQQVDLLMDFVTGENDSDTGSTMMAGTEAKNEFGVVINDPEVEAINFSLASAFDSETHMKEFKPEQQFEVSIQK